MITITDGQFVLNTRHTTYSFALLPSGHLEHEYYGTRIDLTGSREALAQKNARLGGNGISYSAEYPLVGLEDLCLEVSGLGHGDLREPFLELIQQDGSPSVNFRYRKHWVTEGKSAPRTLPAAWDGGRADVEELHILLENPAYPVELELIYAVFPECDVIARRCVLRNGAQAAGPLTVNRLMSLQLDLDDSDYLFHTFTGAWAREMNHQRIPLRQGKWVNESRCGISSSMNNPFVMLSRPDTSETAGACFGLNLIYSGSHTEIAEVNAYGKTRLVTGINPEGFSWQLAPGEELESPEAVMTFSEAGFTGMSRQMHAFVREHIVRGEWQKKERPVLLNSWEAVYFNFDEDRLVSIAERAKEAGIELFVMDDGWFGERNNDLSSLGDWFVNTEKLPGGLEGLARRIEALGLRFGIWVEPEMVCVKSRLYEEHPDWSVEVPGALHSEGRHQRILDLTRADVREWMIETMSRVFGTPGISYVKWDNNRVFTDLYSRKLARQSEFLHRYYMGYYEVVGELTRRFPHILFEGCASGGNRFDLGVLCYMPQIWASDDTDAQCRALIQTGLSYGYPLSTVGAHVSACPNHQTGRISPWHTRFGVAAFGVLGYECNIAEVTPEEFDRIRAQIAWYKEHRKTLQYGDYYRLVSRRSNDWERGIWQWMTAAPDGSEAIGFYFMEQVVPNMGFGKFTARGLAEEAVYRFRDWQDRGLPAGTAGSEEDWKVSGGLLNHAGIRLTQAAAGYRFPQEKVRPFRDQDSRLYMMQRIAAEEPEEDRE